MSKEEKVDNFISITGAEPDVAWQILDSTNWDLENAINIFMENGQQPGNQIPYNSEEPEYRAPIASTNEILSENPLGHHFTNKYSSMNGWNPKNPKAVFEMFRNFKQEQELEENVIEGKGENRDKVKHLSALFRPPIDILCKEDFETAKILGQDSKRWLLVNIQDAAEFSSQQLNRDTWSNQELKELIKTSFIFWQRYYDNEEGARYCTFYPAAAYARPHIGVIDPRTGEMMVHWNNFTPAELLRQNLLNFLVSHSLEGFSAPVKPPSSNRRKKIQDCSEEDQLAAAIAASLNETSSDKPVSYVSEHLDTNDVINVDDDDDEEEVEEIFEKPTKKKKVETPPLPTTQAKDIEKEHKKSEKVEDSHLEKTKSLQRTLPEEPAQGTSGTTDIAIRMTDGSRISRRFLVSEKIKDLKLFVEMELEKKNIQTNFDIMTSYPAKALTNMEDTFEQAGLFPRSLVNIVVT